MRSLTFLRRATRLAVILLAAPASIASMSAQGVQIIVAGQVVAEREPAIPVARDLGGAELRPLTRPQVTAVQRALTRSGIDPGPHDGLMGPQVRRALLSFQVASGLEPCGCLDQTTIRALGLRPRVVQRAGRSNETSVEILAPIRGASSALTAAAGAPEPGSGPGPFGVAVPPGPAPEAPWMLLGLLVPGLAAPALSAAPVAPMSGHVIRGGPTRLRRVRPPGGSLRPGR